MEERHLIELSNKVNLVLKRKKMAKTHKYLTATAALKIVERQAFPIDKMLDTLIRKAEYKIRIVATLKGCYTFWSVPLVYATIPAYDATKMATLIGRHLEKQGFFVRHVAATTLWVSWKYGVRGGSTT